MKKVVILTLLLIFILLQIRLWFKDGSILEVRSLKAEVLVQQKEVAELKERNQRLDAEVQDLKERFGALEERARTDLGMIKAGETFYQLTP